MSLRLHTHIYGTGRSAFDGGLRPPVRPVTPAGQPSVLTRAVPQPTPAIAVSFTTTRHLVVYFNRHPAQSVYVEMLITLAYMSGELVAATVHSYLW